MNGFSRSSMVVLVVALLVLLASGVWFMVAKVDAAEALATWRFESALILGLVLAAVILAAVAVLAAWQSNAKAHYRAMFEAEAVRRRAEERYRVTLMSVAAEKTLRVEKDRAQQYLDVAGVMMVAIDANANVVLVNKKGCEILGCEEREILGKNWFEHFLPERVRNQVREVFARIMAGQSAADEYAENAVLSRSGEERLIAWHNALLHDPSGAVAGTLSSGEDITDRKRAEDALRLRDRAIHAAGEGICITGPNEAGNPLVYVNRGFELLTGYSAEEVLGQNMRFLQGADTDRAVVGRMRAAIKSEQAVRAEVLNYRKDGTSFWNHVFITPVKGTAGKASHFVAILHDISQGKSAEQAIEASRQAAEASKAQYEEVVSMISEVVWRYEADAQEGFVRSYISPVADRMLGLPAGTIGNSPDKYLSYVHPEDLPGVQEMLLRGARTFAKGLAAEYRLCRPDGTTLWVRSSGSAHAQPDGHVVAFGTTADITAHKEDENRLTALQVQLTHASRLATLGELVAGIAHEVNQPLCSIVNYAKACKNTASDEAPDLSRICQWSDAIAIAAAMSGDIIRGMLGFARRRGSTRETLAVGQLVDDAMLLVRYEAQLRKVALRQEMPDKGLAACADFVQIQQVLLNLLRNGIEAFGDTRPADGQVAVRARLVDGLVQVSVSDNGPGRPEAELPKIFEPFFTTKPQGLGLGLPISKTIIEEHGGRIWAEANQSGGLTIHFTLPAGKDKPQDVPEQNGVRD